MILAAIALALLSPGAQQEQQQFTGRVAAIMKTGDGKTEATAWRVKSVSEGYQVIRALGLQPEQQALIMGDNGKAYDVMTVADPKTGEKIELWFDISSFFGKEF